MVAIYCCYLVFFCPVNVSYTFLVLALQFFSCLDFCRLILFICHTAVEGRLARNMSKPEFELWDCAVRYVR